MKRGIWIVLCLFAVACNSGGDKPSEVAKSKPTGPLFKLVSAEESGIKHTNPLYENMKHNIFEYEYLYNGGGVAAADFDNDGYTDLYFTCQNTPNRLYRNIGDFQFEDITEGAGVDGGMGWCTGVTTVDINNDGFLDIYVSKSYMDDSATLRANLLFVNNQDRTFTERAAEYGINDNSYTTQSTFFDMDNDGDLDLYVANHGRNFKPEPDEATILRTNKPYEFSDKLYRNDGGKFTDVTAESGVLNYGFALGVVASDLNGDGYTDIYVANDYDEPDFYYVNNGNGTFTESILEAMAHISNFSMGVDAADFNNDGQVDLAVLDMMAEDNYRQKTNMSAMAPDRFWELVDGGFHYQYMRNMLQVNNGNGTFSDIGQLAGMSKTDWSWAPLFVDMDNDGYKDLLITNGYRRDARNNDFNNLKEKEIQEAGGVLPIKDMNAYLERIPSEKLRNYAFKNLGDHRLKKVSSEWGFDIPSWSNGCSVADLDNDGDLDLVVSNIEDAPFVLQNQLNEREKANFLRVDLIGPETNIMGVGAKVMVSSSGMEQYQELTLTRGYNSALEPIAHFGLGAATSATVTVDWQDGTSQTIEGVEANQVLQVNKLNAMAKRTSSKEQEPWFVDATQGSAVEFEHSENEYNDYDKEILLPHKMSQFGPGLAVGDVNGDGTEDFYVGGAAGQAGALYVQKDGKFESVNGPWQRDRAQEDLGATFFDADGDNDLDLYVVSGGNAMKPGSSLLQDRYYQNNGNGKFERVAEALPQITASGSCVEAADYDNDGDLDLFVGGRVLPGTYPFPARSYLLQNNDGTFEDVTETMLPNAEPGLVTSAVWTDLDADDDLDLVVVGEWMPITFYRNDGQSFTDATADMGMENSTGWWNKVVTTDIDGDGDLDLVAGNLGENYKYQASTEEPLHVYAHDFDENGSVDIVLGYYNEGVCYPVRGRQCSSDQMPFIKKKFGSYHDFGSATLTEVYGDDLKEALHYTAQTFRSVVIRNDKGKYNIEPLPTRAQFSSINGIIAKDISGNGVPELMLAGNLKVSEVETGNADAMIGLVLANNGKDLEPVPVTTSGFYTPGDVKDMKAININGQFAILVANNNEPLQIVALTNKAGNVALAGK